MRFDGRKGKRREVALNNCPHFIMQAPPGIFSILDDVCYTMHAQSEGTDQKFMEKMGVFSSHAHWKGFSSGFQVRHYAGDVS